MRVSRIVALAALCGLVGCADALPMTPANPAAQATGTPVMNIARDMPGGFLNVQMPDGERLPGRFGISETAARDNFTARAAGPRTSLTCTGTMIAGHGSADCQANTGARYHVEL